MQQYNLLSLTNNIGNVITKESLKKHMSSNEWQLNDISINRIERNDNIIKVWDDKFPDVVFSYNLNKEVAPMHDCMVNWTRLKPTFEMHPDFNPKNFVTEYSV